jgi:hypothetical protein
MASNFIDEDDLNTFPGWLKYQAIDPSMVTPDQLATLESEYEKRSTGSKVGLMKLLPLHLVGDHRNAVAVRDGDDLWLTLWLRRNKKGEFFVMTPRAERGWNPHVSYHLDGAFHAKSYDGVWTKTTRQPLTCPFRGAEYLGSFAGHSPKSVGAICDPTAFNGIVEVPPGVLGPLDGRVLIDLVEPAHEPMGWSEQSVRSKVFYDFVPWVVLRVVRGGYELPRDPAAESPA